MSGSQQSPGYQLFMLVLSVYAIAMLAVQTSTRLDPEIVTILDYSDLMVCVVFLMDFAHSLWRAPDRWYYLRTWGWIDLLSSIPALDVARWGRAARIARIFRVLRAIKATRVLTGALLRQRAENGVLAAVLATIILSTLCSIAILLVETSPASNITTAEDAVWWTMTTMTTVGYGDRFPVTTEGRAIAAVLMVTGVGLFSVLSGFLAAWFLRPAAPPRDTTAELTQEVAALRASIEHMQREGRE